MDSGVESADNDWRAQLGPDFRERIVSKIIETLKRHLPSSELEQLLRIATMNRHLPCSELEELKKIATRFEEKIFNLAISQSDYLRKISIKMLTMDAKYRNTTLNSMASNSDGNPVDPETAVSFISWSEEMETGADTYGQFRFYLNSTKLGSVLAAKGIPNYHRNTHQYLYCSDNMFIKTFGGQFGRANSERWNTYDACISWLKGFISSTSGSGSSNDANTTIRQEAINQEANEVPKASDCFFKVMIGNFNKELSIPAKYCRIFSHCTTNQIIILRNGSRSWIVLVNNNVMQGGWEEFVKDHKIKQGEFLVFSHAESNIYDVKIFSCSGCGNCYPWSTDNKEKTTTSVIATVERQEEGVNEGEKA